MFLEFEGRSDCNNFLDKVVDVDFDEDLDVNYNYLIKADNTGVLKTLINKYKVQVDLIYMNPPSAFSHMFRSRKKAQDLIGSKYIKFILERLILARSILSSRGSIYFHTDCRSTHYAKILLDEVFGIKNFRNDISRIKQNPSNCEGFCFGNIKDTLLFYSKTKEIIWNHPRVPYSDLELCRNYVKTDIYGRKYMSSPLHAPGRGKNGSGVFEFKGALPPKGRHWVYDLNQLLDLDKKGLIEWSSNRVPRRISFLDESSGKRVQDVWQYKDLSEDDSSKGTNIQMLKTIVEASSSENSLVLDMFCRSGSFLIAANDLNRRWIGIDSSDEAIRTCSKRIHESQDMFSRGFKTLGVKKDREDENKNKNVEAIDPIKQNLFDNYNEDTQSYGIGG